MGEAQIRLVSAAELADQLSMKVSTVRDLARRQGWPRYRCGHQIRFRAEEILTLLREEAD